MKLLIISNMAHYHRDGQLVGWGPTVQEINALASIFEHITHIGCLHACTAPLSAIPYQAKNLTFIPLIPAGGETLSSKLRILKYTPEYIRTILKWLSWGDVIHVRCPANIPLIALFLLRFSSSPQYRWVKYAGNWQPKGKESFSYSLQRWLLQHNFHKGVVTVNGEWANQPSHVFSFNNPSLSAEEKAAAAAAGMEKQLTPPYRLLFIGRLEAAKGVYEVLHIAHALAWQKVAFQLDLIGDGLEKDEVIKTAEELDLLDHAKFRGWLPRPALEAYYRQGHFILLPSSASEGWPKVLSEAMAYGVVPLASDVSSIPQVLAKTGAGYSFPAKNTSAYLETINRLVLHPEEWKSLSLAGIQSAELFTYQHYLSSVTRMFSSYWNTQWTPAKD